MIQSKAEARGLLAGHAFRAGREWREVRHVPTRHYGRSRAACGAALCWLDALTMSARRVTCPACAVEVSGRRLLRAFRADLDGAL